MRILHITRDFPPLSKGGLSTAVGAMAEAMQGEGVSQFVLSFDGYREKRQGGELEAHVESLANGICIVRIATKSQLPDGVRQAQAWSPQLIHLHHEILLEPALQLRRSCSAPIVYSLHLWQAEQNRLRGISETLSSKAQERALVEADLLHSPSAAVSSHVKGRSQALHTIGLGSPETAEPRERSVQPPTVGYLGRFADVNGFDLFLEAMAPLLRERPELQVRVAGGMPDSPKVERRWRKKWEEMCGEKDRERLHFEGWLSPHEVREFYASISLLVIPSRWETFGQVAMEAMAYGCPIVGSQAGALAERYDEESAVVLEALTVDRIRAGVREILNDCEGSHLRRHRAWLRSQKEGWSTLRSEYLAMYRDAAFGNRAMPRSIGD